MKAFADVLGVEQVAYGATPQAALFLFDLSRLGFKGMDLNVAVITHPAQNAQEHDEQAQLILDYRHIVNSFGFCLHIVLAQSNGSAETPEANGEVVTLYAPDMRSICTSQSAETALFSVFRRQVPMRRLNPFTTSHEASGGMFKGRRDELSDLTTDMETTYLVDGARMIGKTSLLKRAHTILTANERTRDRTYYFDCSVWGGFWDCLFRILIRVDPKTEYRLERTFDARRAADILRLKSAGNKPVILFLDETDELIEKEKKNGWQFTKFLHEAVANRWIRVTFAGFRLVQDLLYDPTSPFYNRPKRVTLDVLSYDDCAKLICEPLANADIQIHDPVAVTRSIYHTTGGEPFLVQYFGETLYATAVMKRANRIGVEEVIAVERSPQLRRFVKRNFMFNTINRGRPEPVERIFALALAHSEAPDGWTVQDFEKAYLQYRRDVTFKSADDALTSLVDMRVLRQPSARYIFSLPLLARILREDYPDLDAAVESVLREVQ